MKRFILSLLCILVISNNTNARALEPDLECLLIDYSLTYGINLNILKALCCIETSYGNSSIHLNYYDDIPTDWEHAYMLSHNYGFPLINEKGKYLGSVDIGFMQINSLNYNLVEDLGTFEEFYVDNELQLIAACREIMCTMNWLERHPEYKGQTPEDLGIIACFYRWGAGPTGMFNYTNWLATGEMPYYMLKVWTEYNRLEGIPNVWN